MGQSVLPILRAGSKRPPRLAKRQAILSAKADICEGLGGRVGNIVFSVGVV